jgi:hypothetical protein
MFGIKKQKEEEKKRKKKRNKKNIKEESIARAGGSFEKGKIYVSLRRKRLKGKKLV